MPCARSFPVWLAIRFASGSSSPTLSVFFVMSSAEKIACSQPESSPLASFTRCAVSSS